MTREELIDLLVLVVQDERKTYRNRDDVWNVTLPDTILPILTADDIQHLQVIHNMDVKSYSERYPNEH